jgi:hypothetical protein
VAWAWAWAWTAAAAALIAAVAAEIILTRHGTFTVRQAAQWIAVSLAALCGLGLGVVAVGHGQPVLRRPPD